MPVTPDRFPGTREEDELKLDPASADPTEVGAMRLVSGDYRMRDNFGVFNPRFDPASLGVLPTNIYPSTLETEPGSKVLVENYAALEIGSGTTAYGWGTWWWGGGAATSVEFKVKFVMKATGAGTNIRLALRIKSRATGESITGADDWSGFVVVPINYTTDGEIFEGTFTVPGSIFADNDAVSIALGRDGNNVLGAGTNDDANRAIQIITAQVRRIP